MDLLAGLWPGGVLRSFLTPHWTLTSLGAGAAGVLCVDLNRATLDGKEMGLAAIARLVEARRKELRDKYESARKKKDPFAVPPTDNDLPRPAPVKLWQKGEGAWH